MVQPGVTIYILVGVWVLSGLMAVAFGPPRYSGRLFLSAIALGPLSVAVALVMTAVVDNVPQLPEPPAPPPPPAPRKIAPGRRRGECLRCGAHTDVPEKDVAAFECWQCGQLLSLKPKPAAKKKPAAPRTGT